MSHEGNLDLHAWDLWDLQLDAEYAGLEPAEIPLTLKDRWGVLADHELTQELVDSTIRKALDSHVYPEHNGHYPVVSAYNSVLRYAQPRMMIHSLSVIKELGLSALQSFSSGGSDRESLVLVDFDEFEKKVRRLNQLENFALTSRLVLASRHLELEDLQSIENQLKPALDRVLSPSYRWALYLDGFLRGLDPHSRIESATSMSGITADSDHPAVNHYELDAPTVKIFKEDPDYSRLKIKNFHKKTVNEVWQFVSNYSQSALILDLRDNSGGLVETWTSVLDFFVRGQQEPIRYMLGRAGKRPWKDFYYASHRVLYDQDLVVLINDGSASASEGFSLNLKSLNRALLIGVNTRGKGSTQFTSQLTPKLQLVLTRGLYFVFGDNSPQFVGVDPHLKVVNSRHSSQEIREIHRPTALTPQRGRRDPVIQESSRLQIVRACTEDRFSAWIKEMEGRLESSIDLQLKAAHFGVKCLQEIN